MSGDAVLGKRELLRLSSNIILMRKKRQVSFLKTKAVPQKNNLLEERNISSVR